jgi:hypothetical protein
MKIGTLTIEMAANLARLEKDMSNARRSVDGAMQKIQRSAQMAMRALGALGLGLGAAQLTSFVKQAIDAGDRMQKLSQQTGIATQNIAGLQLAFRQGGGSAQEMETAVAKLVTAMRNQTDTFKTLNITSKDTFGALSQVADKFQQMPDGAKKSALAYELFGRSGLRLIPILNQGAEGLQNYIELSQKLGTSVTPEVAKQFEKYNDTMDTVSAAMEGLAMQAATALVPALQSVADSLINLFESGAVQRGIGNLIEAFKLLAVVMGARLIGGIAGVIGGLLSVTAGMTAATGATAGLSLAMTGLKGVMALLGGPIGLIVTAASALVYFSEKSYAAENSAEGLAEKLGMANGQLQLMTQIQIQQKIVEVGLELQKLEAQALETAVQMALLNEQISDPEAYLFSGGQVSNELSTINKRAEAFRTLLESLKNQLVDNQDPLKKMGSGLKDISDSTENVEDKIRDMIRAYDDQTLMMQMTSREKEYFLFLNDLEAEGVKTNTELYHQLTDAYKSAQDARTETESIIAFQEAEKKAIEARLEDRIKAEEDFAAEAQKINDQIGQSLTDALVNGGQSAKDFIANMFKTLILRPLIQPIISGTLGALGVGASGAALAGVPGAAGAGGGMDFLGLASTLKDGYSMLTSGFASVGAAATQFVAQIEVASQFGIGVFSEQAAMLAAQESAFSATAASVGAAATVIAGVAAGVAAGTFISGQYALGGDQIISTGLGTAIGTGIGFAVGGPIGAAIGAFLGGAAGGLVNRAFGQGPKQTQNAGLTGTIGAGSTNLSSFTDWKRSGGWFSSGSSGRSMGGVDQGIVDYFNGTLALVSGSVSVMAKSIGLSTEQIAGYSEQIQISLLGLTQVQAQEKLQEAINNFTNGLIVKSLPVISRYQKASESASDTLTRLSQSLATANQIFKAMDMTTLDLTIQAADSASKLIDLTGGIDAFLSKMDFVYQNFFTNQERVDKAVKNLSETFSMLGLVMPDTREQFKDLITVIQSTGNNTLLAALLEIAPAFDSVSTALESEANAAAQIAQNILNERLQFETKISQALGDIASIRQRELENIDESNRGLAMALYALADAQDALSIATEGTDKAFADLQVALETRLTTTLAQLKTEFDALTASLDAQIQAAMEAESAAQNNINSLKSVFTYLQEQINDLSGLGNTTYSFAQAMAYLAQAEQNMLGGQGSPDQAQLASAVSGARAGLSDTSMFSSSFEQQRATGLLVAQLTRLKDATSNQISVQEKQLIVAQEQLRSLYSAYDQATLQYTADQQAAQDAYDNDLSAAKNQIDVLRGIDNSVFSVEQAIDRLNVATGSERDRILSLQEMMVSLQQDANARAQAEENRLAAERQAIIDKQIADENALAQAKIRAEKQAEAERLAEAERIAAQKRAAAAAEAARVAAAAAEAERLRREKEANQWYFDYVFGGIGGSTTTNNPNEVSWGGSQNADGGMFQGGVSLVGEEGPELVNFARPSMIYTAAETQNLLGGGATDDSASEIRQLRSENQAQSRAMISLQNRMTRLLERWDGDGVPSQRYEGETV